MTAGLDQLITRHTEVVPTEASAERVTARIAAARLNDRAVQVLTEADAVRANDDTEAVGATSAQLERLRHECASLPRLYSSVVQTAAWDWQPIPVPEPTLPPTETDDENDDENDEPGRTGNDGRWVCNLNQASL